MTPAQKALLAVLVLAIAGATAYAVWAGERTRPVATTCGFTKDVALTSIPGVSHPQVWGTVAAWTVTNANASEMDVHIYDADAGRISALAEGPGIQSAPQIFGTTVVYREGWDLGYIQLHDLDTGKRERLPLPENADWTPRSLHRENLVLRGAIVGGDGYGLWLYNMSSTELTHLTNDTTVGKVWGNRVAWTEGHYRKTGRTVVVLDVATDTYRNFSHEPGWGLSSADLDVFENHLVFTRSTEIGSGQPPDSVVVVDLSTGNETILDSSPNEGVLFQETRIGGDWMVYLAVNDNDGTQEVHAYNMVTGERKLVDKGKGLIHPEVWGDAVVYQKMFGLGVACL